MAITVPTNLQLSIEKYFLYHLNFVHVSLIVFPTLSWTVLAYDLMIFGIMDFN